MMLTELGAHKYQLWLSDDRRCLFSNEYLMAVYIPKKHEDRARMFVHRDLARAPASAARHTKEWIEGLGFKLRDAEPKSGQALEHIMEAGLRG